MDKEVAINWEEIKKIICAAASMLQALVNQLPNGNIKTVLAGIVALLNLICQWIPEK